MLYQIVIFVKLAEKPFYGVGSVITYDYKLHNISFQ